jgi:hypothetical protein
VVGVRVREDRGVHDRNAFAHKLNPQFRRRVDDQVAFRSRNENPRARAVVPRVVGKADGTFTPDRRHADTSAATENNEFALSQNRHARSDVVTHAAERSIGSPDEVFANAQNQLSPRPSRRLVVAHAADTECLETLQLANDSRRLVTAVTFATSSKFRSCKQLFLPGPRLAYRLL